MAGRQGAGAGLNTRQPASEQGTSTLVSLSLDRPSLSPWQFKKKEVNLDSSGVFFI